MDRVVGLYESEARGRIETLSRISWAVTGLTLATLAAIGLFILRPAVGLIRRQVRELGQARDELEIRVRERTRELELAKERHRTLLEQFSHVGRTSGDRRNGVIARPRAQAAAGGNCQLCRRLSSSSSNAISQRLPTSERRSKSYVAATLRAGQIIERIRTFVTRQEARREMFDANQVIADVQEILRDEAKPTRDRGDL